MTQIPNPNGEKDEKLEFLKREEIRTMQKDIAKLRETETQKERERIAQLPTEEKPQKPQPAETAKKPEELSVTLIPKALPKKLSHLQKILIRAAILLISLLLIGFFYWLIIARPAETPSEKETPLPEETSTEKTTEQPKEETIPPKEGITPPTEEISEKPKVTNPEVLPPSITERILSWGYYIPTATRTIDTIIVHSSYNAIGGDVHDAEKVIEEYKMYRVSPHYLIDRDGSIYQLAPNKAIAYHAGIGKMPDGSKVNVINNFSIGIELIYTKTESPNEAQYQSLAQLVKYLRLQYNIPFENILGHKDIAPERKTDPWNFNWEYFQSLIHE